MGNPLPLERGGKPSACIKAGKLAIGAGALVVAIDGAAIAVLHAVHQRRFHPLTAIGKHGIVTCMF
jgi:hypothetical protein